MATAQRPNVAEFYEREVLPALMRRLDQAFPEFGWRRDARGWIATSAEYTRSTLGARSDRVVCHGEAPRGFLIHGQGAVLWTTYLNDGQAARGRDFISAVRTLAERAGIDASALDRAPTAGERRVALLNEAFNIASRELLGEHGAAARAYLEHRGIPQDRVAGSELGLMPDRERLRLALLAAGFTRTDIDASHLLSDQRWPGRILGAWRDDHQDITTLWARTTDSDDATRYLYLRGAHRTSDVPYGLSTLLVAGNRDAYRELVLVEGVLDVHILRAHDIANVAGLGGTAASRQLFERLDDLGVENVVLALDNDPAGRTATTRAIDAAVGSDRAPNLFAVDPDLLGAAKDPGDLIRTAGADAWRSTAIAPVCAISWRALELTGPVDGHDTELTRHAGLTRSERWLASLPPRLAVEQHGALSLVADSLGHNRDAVTRSFRARFWHRETRIAASRDTPGITR
jgi:DNA primase